jgi:ribosome recycling factor
MGEDIKVSVRNIRRDVNDHIKKEEKASALSEDESKRLQKAIQELTDRYVLLVDQSIQKKEHEIMEI